MEAGTPAATVPAIMAKPRRVLQSARRASREGDWDDAAHRAYYAVFHAMTAALASKGLAFSKHSGVISAFGFHSVKPGILPVEFADIVTKLRADRETSDYSYDHTLDSSEVAEGVEDAEKAVAAISKYLAAQGFDVDA